MGAKPNNGLEVGHFRFLVTDDSGASAIRQAASVVASAAFALIGGDGDLEARSCVLRVVDTATGETVAERRYRSRRLASKARDQAVARYRVLLQGDREPEWTSLLDAST